MHESRKTLLNVLLDNLVNVFNITIVILLVILVINKSYFYLIPLFLALLNSIFVFVKELKFYVIPSCINQRVNVLVDEQEQEKSLSNLKIGDDVVLYPGETIHFAGVITKGIVYVDESLINGSTTPVKKVVGSSIINNSIIVEGSGVVEVKSFGRRKNKTLFNNDTKLNKRIKLINTIFSFVTLLVVCLTFIFDKNRLDNVSKCAIAATPFLFNLFLTLYSSVLHNKTDKSITIHDYTFLSELEDVDVVCLDKTGTITTGDYIVFKTIVLSQTSLSSISLDTNRALDQTVSNILRTTKECNSYYKNLQDHFIYETSRIIEDSSPIKNNGLYSAITVKGGLTYALGEPGSFELANRESASSIINEYESSGYRVLVLVESKNPLKYGLIDGKPTAIGLIILQEQIRESAKELIEYCLNNGKKVKVISGDRIDVVSDICRKAGLENINKSTSINSMSFEQIGLLLEEDIVFADAISSQKAFVVKELQKRGHKVAFVGNGDNDAQALKIADVAISISNGTESSIKCSHASFDHSFLLKKQLLDKAKLYRNKMNSLTAIMYSQNSFALFYLLVFMIASLINKNIYNPFEYNHLVLWTWFGIMVPVTGLIIDKGEKHENKSFLRNFITNSLLLILPIGIMYILQLLQYNGKGYFALPSDINDVHEILITSSVVNNLSYLSLIVLSLVIAFNHFSPFDKIRVVIFIECISVPVAYAILLIFDIHVLSFVTQIETSNLTGVNYFVMGVITVFCSALYLLVLDIIKTIKGENPNVKDKPRD